MGRSPGKFTADIIARIPIRANRDDRYFTAKYQAIPAEGYTAMMQRMLDHKNIRVLLNTDYKEIQNEIECSKIFYSGSIDDFMITGSADCHTDVYHLNLKSLAWKNISLSQW